MLTPESQSAEKADLSLTTLLRELNSRNGDTRELALDKARQLSPDHLVQLAEMATNDYSIRFRRMKRISTVVAVSLTILLLCVLALFRFAGVGAFDVVAWIIVWLLHAGTSWYVPKRARISLARLLSESTDPRLIGSAVVILSHKQTDQATKDDVYIKSVRTALKRMLPELRADQEKLLSREQQAAMQDLLDAPFVDVTLTVAILKALEQIGDEKAIPKVEALAKLPPPTFTYLKQDTEQIVEAAQQCLPYLQMRRNRDQQMQTLLRASSASAGVQPEVLLRAATPTSSKTAPEQLLRSAETGER